MNAISRRGALAGAAALSGLAGLPNLLQAATRTIAGHVPANVPAAKTLGAWLKQLNDFGPVRHTGTKQCRDFEEWLAAQFGKLGCEVMRDQFKLMSWACDISDCSITITEDSGKKRDLEIVAYYPFAKSTKGGPAVTGRLIYGGVGNDCGPDILKAHSDEELAKSIVVVEMPLAGGGIRTPIKWYPGSFPDVLPPYTKPPVPAAQGGAGPMKALEDKCLGLIMCYTDVSNEAARHNILPFSEPHRKIPALWIGAEDTKYLKTVAGKATATMRLDAATVKDARADSFLCVMKGASDEVVYMTTQTDGPNCVNENGALGLLAAATYMSKVKDRKRTFVFSLPTGHYAAGAVRDPVTGSGRPAGTTGNFNKWPQYVDKAVGQIALEQMGALEWSAADMGWKATGLPAPENWIPTPATAKTFNPIFLACAAQGDPKNARQGLVESGQAPGEGGGLRTRGIPGVGLMGSPQYFFRADPKGVLDKVSPDVMHNQVVLVTKLLTLMDRLTSGQLKGTEPVTDKDLYG